MCNPIIKGQAFQSECNLKNFKNTLPSEKMATSLQLLLQNQLVESKVLCRAFLPQVLLKILIGFIFSQEFSLYKTCFRRRDRLCLR